MTETMVTNPTTTTPSNGSLGGTPLAPATPTPVIQPAIQLTPRQQEVLEHMADGQTNKLIAGELSISVKTVEAHRARIFKRLGAENVAQAVRLAIRYGLITA